MSFPVKHLNEGEQVVIDTHPHWWYLAGPVAVVVVVLAGSVALLVAGSPSWVDLVVAAVLVVAVVWLLQRYLRWRTTSFVCTTERLISRIGILGKTGREIPLAHLNDIGFHQTLLDRIVGAGDLHLESAGRSGQEVFPDLPHPARLQAEIYRQLDQVQSRRSGRDSTRELSIPEQIDKLDELRRRGVVTAQEFEAKKADLLGRL